MSDRCSPGLKPHVLAWKPHLVGRRHRRSALHAAALVLLILACWAGAINAASPSPPVRIVALGDSLTAGLGLPADASFPARLQSALNARGLPVEIVNAGVSGDTMSAALARLDWSVPDGTEAAIVELGANDMLLGFDPKATRAALRDIVRRLTARGIAVLIAGMRAAPNLGGEYDREFEPMFSEIASTNNVLLYPFFLDGVAGNPRLNQPDGIHPNAAGVEVIVERILPSVEQLVAQVRAKRRDEGGKLP
jgi:acyl-CoA thioesterase-1